MAEYDPAAQSRHVVMSLAPMTLENFPATQFVHTSEVAAIAEEYRPATHVVQSALPVLIL